MALGCFGVVVVVVCERECMGRCVSGCFKGCLVVLGGLEWWWWWWWWCVKVFVGVIGNDRRGVPACVIARSDWVSGLM